MPVSTLVGVVGQWDVGGKSRVVPHLSLITVMAAMPVETETSIVAMIAVLWKPHCNGVLVPDCRIAATPEHHSVIVLCCCSDLFNNTGLWPQIFLRPLR